MLHVYGIKNCSTVKKALTWLEENQLDYQFHDFKKEGVTAEKLKSWEAHVDWEKLVNKKGTTWRKLRTEEQAAVVDADSANALLIAHSSMIKRPVIETADSLLVGFIAEDYQAKLK